MATELPRFRDALGDEWTPRVTLGVMARFEEDTRIGFSDLFKPEFRERVGLVTRLAYLACARQVAERKIDFPAFGDRFDSQEQVQGLVHAVCAALLLFSRSRANGPAAPGAEAGTGRPSTN